MVLAYLEGFQVGLVLMVIIGLGCLCGRIKLFSVLDASSMRRIIYLIAVPSMLFKEIATHRLESKIWIPLLNSLLTELTIHVFLAAICFAFPFHNKLEQFLEGIFSFAYVNFVFFAIPIINVLYGSNYVYIPVIAGITHFIIEPPIHALLVLMKEKMEARSQSQFHEEEEEEAEERETEIEMDGFEHDPLHDQDNVDHSQGNVDHEHTSADHGSDNAGHDDANSAKDESPKEIPMWKKVVPIIVTPMLVCSILGIIWSATKYEVVSFILSFVTFLENSVMATGLFIIGIFMSDHPFFGCNWFEVIPYLVIHIVIMPLISFFWSWVLNFDKITSQICMLIHALPTGITGYIMAINCGHGLQASSFTFFYSNLLFLPVFMLYITLFNETSVF